MLSTQRKDIYEKALFYFNKKVIVHISFDLLADKSFYNGLIIEISEDRLIIKDRKLGETFVHLSEIKSIEPYMEKNDNKNI